VGLILLFIALTWSNNSIEVSLRGGESGVLEWGPTFFRILLALHGLVLISLAVVQLRCQGIATKIQVDTPPKIGSGWSVWLLLISICTVAIPLRIYRLDTDLWIDEVLTLVLFARPALGEILTSFPAQNQHMLYSLMAKGAITIWGESAWALRLPAVFFSVLSIPALFLLARKLTDKWQALAACALMTLSYHHIWFSQNARGYTGVLFFAILSMWLWVEALSQERWGVWLGYIAVVVLGVWINLTMVFMVASHGLTYIILLLFGKRDKSGRRSLGQVALGSWWIPLAAGALCVTLTLQLYALSLPDFLRSGFHEVSLESEWTQVWWLIQETIRGLHIGYAGWIVVVAMIVVLVTGWLSIFKRNWTVGLSIIVAPVTVCALMIIKGHNLWPRLVFFCAGFGILIVVHGVSLIARWLCRRIMPSVGPRAELSWTLVALGLVLGTSTAMIPKNYRLPKQDYTGARDYVEQRLGSSETVVAIGLAGKVYESYYAPEWKCPKTGEELEAAIRSFRGTWLVYTMPIHVRAYHPDIWNIIQREFGNVEIFPGTLAGGEVFVCKTESGSSALVLPAELAVNEHNN
jgi:uncharacterized membrane protein